MNPRRFFARRAAPCFIGLACLFAGGGVSTAAAAPPGGAPAVIVDAGRLSGARMRACDTPVDPRLAKLGAPTRRACAWSGRLELVYWRGVAAPAGACLPAPGIAWHRLHAALGATAPAWNGAWSAQGRTVDGDMLRQVVAVWRGDGADWSAALWRWRPADRPATRAWEQAHWNDVAGAAQALAAANPAPPATLLLQAWLDASSGKPRVLDGDTARWVSQGACLQLRTTGIGQGQLRLPWSRDDTRLEQRTGMQVQLARRLPQAQWLQPFTLLEPAAPGKRTGAKFIAVWQEGAQVAGQLWMPQRDGETIVRARIATALPAQAAAAAAAPAPTPEADPAREPVRRAAALVQAELTALAGAWEARHE